MADSYAVILGKPAARQGWNLRRGGTLRRAVSQSLAQWRVCRCRGEIVANPISRFHLLNCSRRPESALTSPPIQMERTHVRCYEVQGEFRSPTMAAQRGHESPRRPPLPARRHPFPSGGEGRVGGRFMERGGFEVRHQIVSSLDCFAVHPPPLLVILPGRGGENQVHAFWCGLRVRPRTVASCSGAARKHHAVAGRRIRPAVSSCAWQSSGDNRATGRSHGRVVTTGW